MFLVRSYMLAAVLLFFSGTIVGQPVFESIMGNVRATQWKGVHDVALLDRQVAELAGLLKADGSWSDVQYGDHAQTAWKPAEHLTRLHKLVLAYTLHSSRYVGDATLRLQIEAALKYWYAADPRSTNWWIQQIFCPKQIGEVLILMRSGRVPLPGGLEDSLLARMKGIGGKPDGPYSSGGSNRINIATHWIYRGCLQQDKEALEWGVHHALLTVRFKEPGGGLQPDYSYQEHGRQLYIGNYGYAFVDNISNMALYLQGTPYALSGDQLHLFSKYVRYTYLNAIRGQYYSFSIPGRQIANMDNLNRSGTVDQLYRMKVIDPAYSSIYDTALLRWSGSVDAGYGIRPLHTHYWMSDYTLHTRPGYFFDVRAVSSRMVRTENINNENKKGFFLSEGATNMTIRGDEYLNVFPVWDWCKVPGTTAPHVDSLPDMKVDVGGIAGTSVFSGGVSDSLYGVSCYSMDYPQFQTKAKKAWFFFDKEVVCLGSAIYASSDWPVYTTVNQCLLSGGVTVGEKGRVHTVELPAVKQYADGPDWVLHDGFGYVFPQGGHVQLSARPQSGDWHTISVSQEQGVVTRPVFALWFDHGVQPAGRTYAYVVVPGIRGVKEMKSWLHTNTIDIIANTDTLQAVMNKALQLLEVIFYKEHAVCTSSLARVSVTAPCIVMVKKTAPTEVTLQVADPTQLLDSVTVLLTFPGKDGAHKLDINLTGMKGRSVSNMVVIKHL